jgi:flagellar motor switch protein FliM
MDEMKAPLKTVLNLKVGDTLMLNAPAEAPVTLKCGPMALTTARVGRLGQSVALRVDKPIAAATRRAMMMMEGR